MLTVAQYAQESGLSAARVRSLAASGRLPAHKLGRQWVLLSNPRERVFSQGRPLSQGSFDKLALFLEGQSEDLSPDDRRRAKERAEKIKEDKMAWVKAHARRPDELVKSYFLPSDSLEKISGLKEIEVTGSSHEKSRIFGNLLHAYVPRKKLRRLELIYGLQEVPLAQANLILRAVDFLPPVSRLRLICDLAYEKDPRADIEAQRLLEALLGESSES